MGEDEKVPINADFCKKTRMGGGTRQRSLPLSLSLSPSLSRSLSLAFTALRARLSRTLEYPSRVPRGHDPACKSPSLSRVLSRASTL